MPMKRCMNAGCDVVGVEGGGWRNGWLLRSGGYATLCDLCGLAYEQLVFCDKFHQKESGWRECSFCGKRLHCGCIASKSILDLLDGGGVQCLSCLKSNGNSSIPGESLPDIFPQSSQRSVTLSARCSANEKMNDLGISLADGSHGLATSSFDHTLIDDGTAKCNVMKLGRNTEVHGCDTFFLSQRENTNGFFSHVRPEQVALHLRELGRQGYSGRDQGCIKLSQNVCQSNSKDALKDDSSNAIAEGHLSKSLSSSNLNAFEACSYAGIQKFSLSHRGAVVDGKDQNKALAAFQHVQRPRQVLPKLPKANHGAGFDVAKELAPQMRVARPPVEGRGRNQLLPRYWPRITDQELQQISGDSNSTIVPLFEKVLSASDAGRIGRLVLPKACAEAYFPPISQPEGLPLKIQDAKGKEWHFQFRFWPNNNSRMYVLEGVTPCIQSLQLQAGDTVTFSRMDPEGKLVMGFRKATNTAPLQESQISTMGNGALGNEAIYPGVNNLSIVNGYSGLIQTLKGTGTSHLSHFSENLNCTDGDISCMKTDMHGSWAHEGLLQPLLVLDQRSRSIGSKSKRLLMDNDDAMELQLTWEEAQDLLRPPPRVKPSVVIIEDQEFEEYEEPPVLGKRTFFTAQPSGGLDQWIQCDDCLKWRRIPVEVLPPSKWACVDNNWDPKRSSCAVTDELTPSELQALLLQHAEIKRRRITSSKASSSEAEPTGVGALGSAAVLGQMGNQSPSTVATTTRHPRHRPGCTCIVCIQPPSGKGPKHSPNCTCNVCMTVKRRFKTLMMRKKKRQFEREEADTDKRSDWVSKEELDGSGSSLPREELVESLDASKGHIDLNRQPQRDAGQQVAGTSSSPQLSMTSLIQIAGHPLENYLKQNKLVSSTTSEHQVSSSSATIPQVLMESDSGGDDEHCGSEKIVSPAAAA